MKKLFLKVSNFWKIPGRNKALFFQVIGLSIYRGYLVATRSPQAHSEKLFKKNQNQQIPTLDQLKNARDIAYAIKLGAKYIPWKNVCRHQSWQAGWLLQAQNIPFSYQVGVKKSGKPEGHSWVKVGDIFISGECEVDQYHLLDFSDQILSDSKSI